MSSRKQLKLKRKAAKKLRLKVLRRAKKRLGITGRVDNFSEITLTIEDFR